MRNSARWVFVVGCVALSACGGGSTQSVGAPAAPAGAIPFTLSVPARSTVTSVGFRSSLESGTPEHRVDVSPTSSACIASADTRVCSATLRLPLGAQVLSATTNGARSATSSWRTTLDGTRVSLAVGGTIAQISLDLAAPQLAGGQSGTTTLYVTPRDASGNVIVGDLGGATIALASTDTTNSVSLSPSSLTAGGPVTVSYNGSGNVSSVTFSATSSGVASTAITSATLTFTASQLMYVTSGNSVLAFPINASGDVAPLRRYVLSSGVLYGATPDGHGSIWAISNVGEFFGPYGPGIGAQSVVNFPATATGTVTPASIASASLVPNGYALDIGSDAYGNVYVLFITTNYIFNVAVIAPGTSSAARVLSFPAYPSSPYYCNGLAVRTDGAVAVNCTDQSDTTVQIYVFAPNATTPTGMLSGSATLLHTGGIDDGGSYLAYGPDGSLATNDYTVNPTTFQPTSGSLLVFAPNATGNSAPARVISGNGTGLGPIGGGPNRRFAPLGIGIDATGALWTREMASVVGNNLVKFAPNASGAALPVATLGGPLTSLSNSFSIRFSSGTVAATPAVVPSVSGDFLALAANRGWNYQLLSPPTYPTFTGTPTPVPSPLPTATPTFTTLSLYANPTPVNGDTQVAVVEYAAPVTTAIGQNGAIVAGEATFRQNTLGGWFATSYTPFAGGTNLGGTVPIPSGLTIVPGTLVQGQTFAPYLGVTATVISVGSVPGASACPGGAATGAIVAYSFGRTSETVGYVPGCGITYFVSDNGSTATLTSVGSYSAGQLSSARRPLGESDRAELRALGTRLFTPWRP